MRGILNGCVGARVPLSGVLLERGIVKDSKTGARYRPGYTPNYTRVLVAEGEVADVGANTLLSVMPSEIWIDKAQGDAALVGS